MLKKVTLHKEDYTAIAAVVRQQLRKLLPESELANKDLIFGPEFMAPALRITTPSTKIQFDKHERQYIKFLRQEINSSTLSSTERQHKHRQLDSIILFGQVLLAQSACLYFLKKPFGEENSSPDPSPAFHYLQENMHQLINLAEKEGVQFSSSKLEALSRRKEFSQRVQETKRAIVESPLTSEEKKTLIHHIQKAQSFYFQANDFNFNYANKPSRGFSNFLNNFEYYGSKVSLAAAIIALGATALSFIPPLAPVMGVIATVASSIALAISIPLALKTIGTMLYNLIRFGAAPTPTELVTTALVGTSVILMGAGSATLQAVQHGVAQSAALTVTQGLTTANDLVKMIGSLGGEVMVENGRQQMSLYKNELTKIGNSQESNSEPDSSPINP